MDSKTNSPNHIGGSLLIVFTNPFLHLGIPKTIDKILEKLWFPHMNKFVRKFIENCITCKIAKSPSGKTHMDLHMIPKIDIPTVSYSSHRYNGPIIGS